MHDYISLRINSTPCDETVTDLLADAMAEIGFESFEPDSEGVTCYIRKSDFLEEEVERVIREFILPVKLTTQQDIIEGEDWNKEWETNYFKPITIADKCEIRSTFHEKVSECPIEILIDPKMAFGTGHHATTAGMVTLLLEENLKEKRVIDMGTGTGILAILCKKLGAKTVTGIEIDEYALENARENGELNSQDIFWIHGSADNLPGLEKADYFLANINLNVILNDLPAYLTSLKSEGKLLLSGFYKKDLPAVKKALESSKMKEVKNVTENEWIAVMFERE